MSATIDETVNSALRDNGLGSYAGQARPVVEALRTREASISDELIQFATENGMDAAAARNALRGAGMAVREPAVGSAASAADQSFEAQGDLAAVLNRIDGTLNSLAQFARDNGWRG